ncbi:MAG: LysR family transcriptional regulator [Christensenellaceae bacterium]|jgi:DNA-binding transcriptional LysR family regulator
MNIQHMKYAIEVEKTGSISQAAQNLYMGQPNLSKAIKELENSLGITLFRRTSKGVVPTEKGEEFLVYAKRLLKQVDEIEAMYRPGGAGQENVFRISVPRSSYIANVFTAFVAAMDMKQGAELTIRETNSLQTIRDVAEDNYNLGVIRYQADNEQYFQEYMRRRGLKSREILSFEYSVLMSSLSPLAVEKELRPDMLAPYIEILHGDLAVPFVPEKEEGPMRAKRRIYVFERGSQFDLLTRISESYMWVSPMPKDILRRNYLTIKKCRDSIRHKDVLVYRDSYRMGKLDELFLAKLEECEKYISDV